MKLLEGNFIILVIKDEKTKNVDMRIVENYYKVKTCVIRDIDVVLKGRKIVLICFLKKRNPFWNLIS